jgi:hypothetical protein
MLQPSLAGNARISVIATLNPDPSAIVESTSTLLFAQRIKKVQVIFVLESAISQYIYIYINTEPTLSNSSTHRRKRWSIPTPSSNATGKRLKNCVPSYLSAKPRLLHGGDFLLKRLVFHSFNSIHIAEIKSS